MGMSGNLNKLKKDYSFKTLRINETIYMYLHNFWLELQVDFSFALKDYNCFRNNYII